jgi:hypothetical protein
MLLRPFILKVDKNIFLGEQRFLVDDDTFSLFSQKLNLVKTTLSFACH